MIKVENRDKILRNIFDNGLFAGTNFPSVSWMFKRQHSVRAEAEAEYVLNLFNDHRVDESFAERICDLINQGV